MELKDRNNLMKMFVYMKDKHQSFYDGVDYVYVTDVEMSGDNVLEVTFVHLNDVMNPVKLKI